MNIAIALAQFIMLALATMASHILVNSGAVPTPATTLSDQATLLIAGQGLWLLLIPAIWLLVAEWCMRRSPSLAKAVQPLGAAIAMGVLVLIVLVLAL